MTNTTAPQCHRPAWNDGIGAADTAAGAAADGTDVSPGDGAPLGSPVLNEVPALGGALADLVDADRRQVRALLAIAELRATDEVEATTGVSLEHWLGIAGRQTRLDRRLLLRLCSHLDRFPALRAGAEQGRLSFAQLRGISLRLKDAPAAIDADLDRWLAAAIDALDPTAEPDVLVKQTEQAIVELAPAVTAEAEQQASRSRYLHLQPRLDGSGGRISGQEDALGFAIIADAVAVRPDQLDHPGGIGEVMADNLLERLTHVCDTSEPPRDGSADGCDTDAGGSRVNVVDGVTSTWQRLPQVKLLARISFESLLDRSQTPAELLTRLVGGKLRLTAAKARQLIDARGAELRAIVVDEFGQVVGVGRSTRRPAGWLRDATLALHDTCTGPLCELPARDAQLDHATPWWPVRPGDPYGTTDLDNIGPLCDATNQSKEAAGWSASQTGDGQRTWRHQRSGLTVTTVPATWRPPGFQLPERAPDRHDPPGDPPGDPPATGPPGDRSVSPWAVDRHDDGSPMPF